MTMLNIGGVPVIFEGVHRLRWQHRPSAIHHLPVGTEPPPTVGRIVGQIWPDVGTRALLRREIDHGRRTVVVLDGEPDFVVLPRHCVPRIPVGAVARDSMDAETVVLQIPPLTWLGLTQQARGLAFAGTAGKIAASTPQEIRPPILVEEHLIGSSVPLRFVYHQAPIAIDELREVIAHLFKPGTPAASQDLSPVVTAPQYADRDRTGHRRAA